MGLSEPKNNNSDDRVIESHPFGGCNKLLTHYRTIGVELLRYDSSIYRYGYSSSFDFADFREGVAAVPLEVLESYFEDLLDLEVAEERLCISRERGGVSAQLVALFGLLVAVGVGLYAASSGASLVLSFGLTVSLSLPFAAVWHMAPRSGLIRRLAFAQILTQEISRRRGSGKDDSGKAPTGLVFTDFLRRKAQGTAQGATRQIFH